MIYPSEVIATGGMIWIYNAPNTDNRIGVLTTVIIFYCMATALERIVRGP